MSQRPKITVPKLKQFKQEGRKITMLTAYDYTFARFLEEAEVDMVLVGDSLGMVVQGQKNTLPVTLDEMIYHARCVSRALDRSHLIVDMPFMSYQASPEQPLLNCGRVLKEAAAESVKLEEGRELSETIRRLTQAGIPVMAHIGLKPQSIHQMGGYVVQGRKEEAARNLIKEAKAHEEAGAYALLLEGIPAAVAAEITAGAQIPTIGIGAGVNCDGQVLVIYDLLGMDKTFNPKFCKTYAQLHEVITQAIGRYIKDVQEKKFPAPENAYGELNVKDHRPRQNASLVAGR